MRIKQELVSLNISPVEGVSGAAGADRPQHPRHLPWSRDSLFAPFRALPLFGIWVGASPF